VEPEGERVKEGKMTTGGETRCASSTSHAEGATTKLKKKRGKEEFQRIPTDAHPPQKKTTPKKKTKAPRKNGVWGKTCYLFKKVAD